MAGTAPARAITIDGVFSDWTSQQIIGTDGASDVGDGDPVDWLTLWAKFENGGLYVSYTTGADIDFAQNAWRYSVFLDTDSLPATGYRGGDLPYAMGAEYLIEGATIYKYTGHGNDWVWSKVGSATYAISRNRLEMRIGASATALTAKSKIKIMLVGNNNARNDFARNDRAGFAYPADPVVVDGAFADWAAVTPIGTDAAGDVSASDIVDWTDVRVLGRNGTLYLNYTSAKPIDLFNNGWRYGVLIDADNNNRSGYTNITGGVGAEYLVEGATLYRYQGDGTTWQWDPVTQLSAAVSGKSLELAVAASHLGISDSQFSVRLRLIGSNDVAWDLAPELAPGFLYRNAPRQNQVACQRMAIPSYFRNSGGLWDKALAEVPPTQIMLINPINGPGEAPQDDFSILAATASARGAKVFGYVSTQYSGRDPALVKEDINRYANWYPSLDGIFLDEVSVFCSVLGYYTDIDRYISSFVNSKGARFTTVLNNGGYPGECYMSAGDIIVREEKFSVYRNAVPPSWTFNYSPERFWHIVWQATQAQMSTAIDISRRRNAGFVYVTNDTLPNPYDTLPTYWNAEMTKLSELCD
jgi:hypothetical protein